MEVIYGLMTFGLPPSAMPMHADGRLKPEINELYLVDRQRIEAEEKRQQQELAKTQKCIDFPGPNDVLLGRGRPYQEYTGNQRLAALVEGQREQYQQAADRFEKTCISLDVVKTIQETQGRFLQRTDEGWEAVTDFLAREKVSHSFRTKTTRLLKPIEMPSFDTPNQAKKIKYDDQLVLNHHQTKGGLDV
jgi:hypothetical protein